MRHILTLSSLLILAALGACSSQKDGSQTLSGFDSKDADRGTPAETAEDPGRCDAAVADGGGDADNDAGPTKDAGDGGQVGDPCTLGADCKSGLWCKKPESACDGPGTCADYEPLGPRWDGDMVCGCNGRTYTARTDASHAMVNVASTGLCPSAETCLSNADCSSDAFCLTDNGGRCGGPGHCVEQARSLCPLQGDAACSCDGQFSRRCALYSVGLNVDGSRFPPTCERL